MRSVIRTSGFDRSLKKLLKKRSITLQELMKVVDMLIKGKKLPKKYKDHKLKGKLRDFRECHIHSDVLLLYYIVTKDNKLVLYDLRTHDTLER